MNRSEIGQIVLRVILGVTFLIHGFVKFQGGIANTAGYFESLGIPAAMAFIVATIELVGGAMLIVGIGTRYIAAALAVIMLVAIVLAKLSLGFLGNGQMAGYELELLLFGASVFFVFADTARLSLDHKLATRN